MIPGGGKRKGGIFERKCGVALSLWVSEGARADLFARTVLSGGKFTLSKIDEGIPGDLMASHPMAFEFMALFAIEAKHYRDIGLDKYLLDLSGHSFLAKVYEKIKAQGRSIGLAPMVIAKQNHHPAVIIVDYAVGAAAQSASRKGFRYHVLHSNSVVLTTLDHFLAVVKPKPFLQAVKLLQIPVGSS